jgi:hypothetical protein
MKLPNKGALVIIPPGTPTWVKIQLKKQTALNVGPYITNPVIALVTSSSSPIMRACTSQLASNYFEAITPMGHRLIVEKKDAVLVDDWHKDSKARSNRTRR